MIPFPLYIRRYSATPSPIIIILQHITQERLTEGKGNRGKLAKQTNQQLQGLFYICILIVCTMQEDFRKCELCGASIMPKCFDIHSRACAKKLSKSSPTKQSFFKPNPVELIPCAECGEMVDFSVFSIHMEECVGRQLMKCPKCKLLYPTFLFEQHSNICTQFREEAEPQPLLEEIEEEEDFDFDLGEMIMHLAKNNSKDNSEPLSLDQINKLKKAVLNKSEECSVCYCQITKGSSIFRLHCPHKFHTRCITAWLQKNPQCPMCRRHALY